MEVHSPIHVGLLLSYIMYSDGMIDYMYSDGMIDYMYSDGMIDYMYSDGMVDYMYSDCVSGSDICYIVLFRFYQKVS